MAIPPERRSYSFTGPKVAAHASEDEIRELMKFTDTVAEIQNTVLLGTPVVLTEIEAVSLLQEN